MSSCNGDVMPFVGEFHSVHVDGLMEGWSKGSGPEKTWLAIDYLRHELCY